MCAFFPSPRKQQKYFALATAILYGMFSAGLSPAQNYGRFHELKSQAIRHLQNQQFDKASALLEEVSEQEPGNALVAELLAIAYLNGEARRIDPLFERRARERMEDAVRLGGQTTFLVRLINAAGTDIVNDCNGRLSVRPGRLVFVPDPCRGGDPAWAFDAKSDQVSRFDLRARDSRGAAWMIVAGRRYEFLPYSQLRDDGLLMVEFVNRFLRNSP